MTVKEAHEAGLEGLPVLFKGNERYPQDVFSGMFELGTIYRPTPAYHVRLQDRLHSSAFEWKDIAECRLIRSCKECPLYDDENANCGNCPLYCI